MFFLLAFVTTTEITFQKSTNNCKNQTIATDKLEINTIPLSFRNSYDDNEKNKQMLIQLEVSKTLKKCMDTDKFNLTIDLNETVLENGNGVKISSTATQHIVKIGKQSLEIESCNDSAENKKNTEKHLKSSLGVAKGKGKNKIAHELIFFMAPFQLWDVKDKVVNIKLSFASEEKKTCDYRECLANSFY